MMNFKRILCPIDFSDFNEAANEYASVLAQASGAELVYLHVMQPDVPFATYSYANVELEEAEDRKRLQEVKPTVAGIKASYIVEIGSPGTSIASYANDHGIDLIVLGTHGRTGFRRAIMGSIAEAVVRNADCPVLAVKSDSHVPQPA